MKSFTLMNSLRNEVITKKRSKDTRILSACFKRKVRGNLRELYFLACLLTPFYGEKKMENKRFTGVRLNEDDRELLEAIAKRYDISISDVVRIAIKEYIKSNGIKLKEGS